MGLNVVTELTQASHTMIECDNVSVVRLSAVGLQGVSSGY